MKTTNNHYDKIANKYNSLWLFSEDYIQWYLKNVERLLEIQQNDVVADIGGGTGLFGSELHKNANLKNNIVCVEPSEKMCSIADCLRDVEVMHDTADAFFKKGNEQGISKILMKEMIHHIPDRKKLFKDIYSFLNKGSVLIATREKEIEFPFFKKALQEFSDSQDDYHIFIQELEDAGFSISVEVVPYQMKISSRFWEEAIRNRFMSHLSSFTSEEIEEGINELRESNPQGQDYIFYDNLVFIQGKKR